MTSAKYHTRSSPGFGGRNALNYHSATDGGGEGGGPGSPLRENSFLVGMAIMRRVKSVLGLKMMRRLGPLSAVRLRSLSHTHDRPTTAAAAPKKEKAHPPSSKPAKSGGGKQNKVTTGDTPYVFEELNLSPDLLKGLKARGCWIWTRFIMLGSSKKAKA